MKTIQQYANEYRASSCKDEKLGEIAVAMIHEVAEAGRTRQLMSDASSLFALITAQDRKWQQFASDFPEINQNGFAALLEAKMPDIYREWMRSRVQGQ